MPEGIDAWVDVIDMDVTHPLRKQQLERYRSSACEGLDVVSAFQPIQTNNF